MIGLCKILVEEDHILGQEQKPDDNKGLKKWDKMRARKFISGPNFAHLSGLC